VNTLPTPAETPRVSVVVPVRNEEGNVAPLIGEIEQALADHAPFEIVYVDDGSSDRTAAVLADLAAAKAHLRVLRHAESCGQSAAIRTGVRAARAPIVATLDGDGQNDPAFIPAMIEVLLANARAGLIQGERQGRKATGFKRLQSSIANRVRRFILNDGTRDTGCGLKVFRRGTYLDLPWFQALHRFMPALVARDGLLVIPHPVRDRPRFTGVSNYGFFDRLWVGIIDLFGVWWLLRRGRRQPRLLETP
jgi:glycosyltransferase involved in cell wall biosynthesis